MRNFVVQEIIEMMVKEITTVRMKMTTWPARTELVREPVWEIAWAILWEILRVILWEIRQVIHGMRKIKGGQVEF